MKKCYYLLGFTLLLSLLFNRAVAQANYASVTNFEILPQYLNAAGKVKINPSSPTTTIQCKVSFVRVRGQLNSWQETNMIVGLVSATLQATTIFNDTKHITNASFPNEVAYLNDVIMTVVLEKSKLGFGKIELMRANGPSFSNTPRYATGYIYNYELDYGGMPASLQGYAKEFGPLPSTPMTLIYPNDNTPALSVGSSVFSPNQQYRLTLQVDGNVVLYKRIDAATEQALWSTGTQGSAVKPKTLFLQTDGHLVLYLGTTINSGPIWGSGRYAGVEGFNSVTNNVVYALQDDGNLVFYWLYPQNGQIFKWSLGSTRTTGGLVSHRNGLIVGWDD